MTTSTLGNFAARMNAVADGVEKNADKMIKEVVMVIALPLVYATPVDTGRARANWQGGVNTEPSEVLFPAPDAPATPDEGTQLGIESIQAAAESYKSGGYVAIVNNVPYISELNDGSSSQAPEGFVQISVLLGIKSLANIKLVPQ